MGYFRYSFPYSKTKAAFLLSCDTLAERNQKLYFWTFTALGPLGDRQFAAGWNFFLTRLRRSSLWAGMEGLRVFERHEGGGERDGLLHCHIIINRWWPVRFIRVLLADTGLGRVHARAVCENDGAYLAKYLSKGSGLGHGLRAWGKIGRWTHSRVSGLWFDSIEANEFRECYEAVRGRRNAYILARQLQLERQAMRSGRYGSFRRIILPEEDKEMVDITTVLKTGEVSREHVAMPGEEERRKRHAWFADRIARGEAEAGGIVQ